MDIFQKFWSDLEFSLTIFLSLRKSFFKEQEMMVSHEWKETGFTN